MRIELGVELGPAYAGQWVEISETRRTAGDILAARRAYREHGEETGPLVVLAGRILGWSYPEPPSVESLISLEAGPFLVIERAVEMQLNGAERGSADTKGSGASSSSRSAAAATPTSS